MKLYQLYLLATAVAAHVIQRTGAPKAVYFLDNNPAGSSVVSLEVDGEGMLSRPVKTSTGGVGMYSVSAPGTPALQGARPLPHWLLVLNEFWSTPWL